jgi:anti-sigma regulatory factor (Ser/Thr protein kinase)
LPGAVISPEVRHNVFLASKEAITNIVRHSQASAVSIRLSLDASIFSRRSKITLWRGRVDDTKGGQEMGCATCANEWNTSAAVSHRPGIRDKHEETRLIVPITTQ